VKITNGQRQNSHLITFESNFVKLFVTNIYFVISNVYLYSQTKESVHRFQVGFWKCYTCAKLIILAYLLKLIQKRINMQGHILTKLSLYTQTGDPQKLKNRFWRKSCVCNSVLVCTKHGCAVLISTNNIHKNTVSDCQHTMWTVTVCWYMLSFCLSHFVFKLHPNPTQ